MSQQAVKTFPNLITIFSLKKVFVEIIERKLPLTHGSKTAPYLKNLQTLFLGFKY